MFYVITELQDFYGFAIVDKENFIKGNFQDRLVFSGTEEECTNFYQDRITDWVDSQDPEAYMYEG